MKKSKAPDPEKYAASGTEHGMQTAIFMWASQEKNKYPELKWLFAIPNGGSRHIIEAGRLKAAGVKPGVPDIMLPIKRGPYSGLWLELKRPKTEGKEKGYATSEQKEWIAYLRTQGYGAAVCTGFIQARDMIIEYLEYK